MTLLVAPHDFDMADNLCQILININMANYLWFLWKNIICLDQPGTYNLGHPVRNYRAALKSRLITSSTANGVFHSLICRVNNQASPVTATALHGNCFWRGCWEIVFLLACFNNHSLGLSKIKLKTRHVCYQWKH